MSILLKQVRIVDSTSPFNNEVKDILIKNDQIVQIADAIEEKVSKTIQEENLCVSPGWFEMHSDFSDPGNEHKEDLESGAKAAMFGGFTSVAITPNTVPTMETKAQIEYVYKRGEYLPIQIYPLGAATKGLKGTEMTELYDMYEAGAIGFYNGKNTINDPNIQKLVMLYTRTFEAPLMVFSNQKSLSDKGQMHEGDVSTFLALKGMPSLAEELMVNRDLYLTAYAESPLHFATISTEGSVNLIREAKAKGLNVTCSVNLYNLIATDKELDGYDTRYKVLPPLRQESDRLALIEGLKDGTIDAISIDHSPQDIEVKKCEFEHAAFGMRGLENAAGLYGKHLSKDLGWEKWVDFISHNPRSILDAPKISINTGAIAELTLFNPTVEWKIDLKKLALKSENSPFYGETLKGKSFGIINKGTLHKA